MKQSLGLFQRQHLSLTPQLKHVIRLMQLSSVELRQELLEVCEANPLLELDDEIQSETETFEFEEPMDDFTDENVEYDLESSDFDDVNPQGTENEYTDQSVALENDACADLSVVDQDVEASWTDVYTPPDNGNTDSETKEPNAASHVSLTDHLLGQVHLLDLTDKEEYAVAALIDALDSDGYLTISLEEFVSEVPVSWDIDLAVLQKALATLQSLSPSGVGARNVQECLLVQVAELPSSHKGKIAAETIVTAHFDDLVNRRHEEILSKSSLSAIDLTDGLALIQSLNPRPGAAFYDPNDSYIVTDVLVRKAEGEYVVELNDQSAPQLRINSYYANLMNEVSSKSDQLYLREKLKEAKLLVEGLEYRNSTLLKTAFAIVQKQTEFFDHGESHMRPMVRAEIAQLIGVHESTVSRVTNRKYLASPRGTFELSYFFSSHVHNTMGQEISSTAIRAIIRSLTDEEDPAKPLSDSSITSRLRDMNIRIARRTVAKYRESLSIPPSTLRQKSI